VALDDIHRGDILLYRCDRGVRAHRVTRAARSEFILRGDAGGDDERVPAKQVLGRVISLEREGRRVRLRGPAAALRRKAFRIRQEIATLVR
jgi:hypothetical protein